MKKPNGVGVVWLFEENHTTHPMIGQGIAALLAGGYRVIAIDQAHSRSNSAYGHIALRQQDRVRDILLRLRLYGLAYRWRTPSFLTRAVMHAVAQRPSVILATSYKAIVAGWLAASLLRARFIYYPLELYFDGFTPVSKQWLKLERLILRWGIHALITQNEARASVYVEEGGSRVKPAIVHNYKAARPADQSGRLRAALKLPEDCRIVLYEGKLSRERLLDRLARAAAFLPDNTRLVFMGRSTEWWKTQSEALLSHPEFGHKILLAPEVPYAEVGSFVADADVGVIIYDGRARNCYYCEPGKLSDYVLAGVPVVAPNFPTIAPTVRDYGIGAVYESAEPEEIARQINHVLSVPREAWRPALERARQHLVWETQAPSFLQAVAGLG